MTLARDAVERKLTQKLEMTHRKRRGDDHRRYDLLIDGQRIARTMVSTGTGSRTLGDNLVSQMARQLKVPTPFFRELISCSKSRAEYLEKLRDQQLIE
jgi:hypothetical protein